LRDIEPFFVAYMVAWGSACVVALALVVLRPGNFSLASTAYRRYLLKPWKVTTFVLAAAGLAIMAPYTGDPTWDYYDALLMAVLTFITAPWSVGTVYRFLKRMESAKALFVALCAWFLSASWCYDLYLVVRDGTYPSTWFANLVASSILYILAGMLWNLEWRAGRGVVFGFMERDWPNPAFAGGAAKLVWYAVPIMLLVGGLLAPFLWGGWG
jgi:hypothetical protein